jgi:4-nitrophenyl phosphatase
VEDLRRAGKRVVFLTNNSGPLLGEHVDALSRVGIDCGPEDVATSAQAAAALVRPGETVALVGDRGVKEALEAKGAPVVGPDEGPAVVMVGRKVELDYSELAAAATAVRNGARFIATNTDATFPAGEDGLLPGAGALVAFISTAAGRGPEVAGKPHEPMAALVRSRFGLLEMMVGDRPDTDGRFARRVGARFGLVLSGVTGRTDLPVQPTPDVVADDLAGLARQYLEGTDPNRGPAQR